jgi:CRISPR/Cas system CSM-associated protein Csm5 (group 7 of RAMP superfamily)
MKFDTPVIEPSFIYTKKVINSDEMTESKWLEFKNSNIPYPDLLTEDIHSDMEKFIENLKEISKDSIIWKTISQSPPQKDFKLDNWMAKKKITKIKIKKEKKKIKKHGIPKDHLLELQEELYSLQ